MKFLIGDLAISAFISCTKNEHRNSLPAASNSSAREPYVTMDGQDYTGWTIWDDKKKECAGSGRTCAPEVVVEYKMDF